jgi:hypothetical protein
MRPYEWHHTLSGNSLFRNMQNNPNSWGSALSQMFLDVS